MTKPELDKLNYLSTRLEKSLEGLRIGSVTIFAKEDDTYLLVNSNLDNADILKLLAAAVSNLQETISKSN